MPSSSYALNKMKTKLAWQTHRNHKLSIKNQMTLQILGICYLKYSIYQKVVVSLPHKCSINAINESNDNSKLDRYLIFPRDRYLMPTNTDQSIGWCPTSKWLEKPPLHRGFSRGFPAKQPSFPAIVICDRIFNVHCILFSVFTRKASFKDA